MGDHRVTIRIIFKMHGHEADSGEMWLNGSADEAMPRAAQQWVEDQHDIAMRRYDDDQAKREAAEFEAQQRALYERLKAKYEPSPAAAPPPPDQTREP